MATIKVHKNKLIITRSLGILTVFGVPLVVSGVLVVSLFFNSFEDYWPGIISLLLGLVIATGRTGVIFNRDTEQITTWWGIELLPFHCKYQSLNLYNKLILDRKIDVVMDDDGYHIYSIQMVSDREVELDPLIIHQSTDLFELRAIAEQIANYMDKLLQDKSTDWSPTHQTKKTSLAYRLGLQNRRKYSSIPSKNQFGIIVKKSTWGTKISILPCGFLNSFLAFFPHCIAAVILCIFMMKNMSSAIIHQYITFTSFIFISIIIYFTMCAGRSVTQIIIDATEIKVDQYIMFGRSKQVLQIHEMEEIVISEDSYRLLPTIDRKILSLVSTTQAIEITGMHSAEKLGQLKKIIYQIIDFPMQIAEL